MQDQIVQIIDRLEKLEAAVFNKKEKNNASQDTDFTGPKGGCLLLISKGFFDKKKIVNEVKLKLDEMGYIYLRSVIQTSLNRLSGKNGPLVSMTENGTKFYAKRK